MGAIIQFRLPKDFLTKAQSYREKFGVKVTARPAPMQVNVPIGKFEIKLLDREIWVNDFLLSKPYAAGRRMALFEYFYENPFKKIKREEMPEHMQRELSLVKFSKILNAIGFKGELLKAFFPERGKSVALFRKEVLITDLLSEGVKIEVLMAELRLAHSKAVPSSPI